MDYDLGEWRSIQREIGFLIEGSHGLTLDYIKKRMDADEFEEALIERVLLVEFIDKGFAMAVYMPEDGVTFYFQMPEDE